MNENDIFIKHPDRLYPAGMVGVPHRPQAELSVRSGNQIYLPTASTEPLLFT